MKLVPNRVIRSTTTAIAVGALTSCTLINPHLDFKQYGRQEFSHGNGTPMERGVRYAEETQRAYRAALGERSQFRNLLGIGLIPLSALTLALGIRGTGGETLLWLGTGGAAAYGTGTWINSTPTERSYILGYNAINCALTAAQPFRIADDNISYTAFKTGLQDIDQNIEAVEKQITVVQTRLIQLSGPQNKLADLGNQNISIARSVVTHAISARKNGNGLDTEMAGIGEKLKEAVNRITGQVDLTLNKNARDLQGLMGIIRELGATQKAFTRVPESLRSNDMITSDAGTGQQGLTVVPKSFQHDTALEIIKLQSKVSTLSSSARKIADFVNKVAASKPQEAMKACGVDSSSIAGEIEVDPAGAIQFTAQKRQTTGRVITGGVPPYRASIAGSAPGIAVSQPELFGPVFVLETEATVAEGSYALLVADGSGQRKTIPIIVGSAAPLSEPAPRSAYGRGLNDKPKVKAIQRALCMPNNLHTGNWLDKTDMAFAAYKNGPPTKTGTDEEIIEELLKFFSEKKKKCVS